MRKKILFAVYFCLGMVCASTLFAAPNVWINEIHYNNAGTNTNNGFEIAGPAGTDLSCYQMVFYDGTSGHTYATNTLTGTIPNQQAGYGTVWFNLADGFLQNTSNGAFALMYAPAATSCGGSGSDTMLLFLSYGGAFTASNGPANGVTSSNIGFTEDNNTTAGFSLQLGGTGKTYSDFSWQDVMASTHDAVNTNQTFISVYPSLQFIVVSSVVTEHVGSFMIAVQISDFNNQPTSVDVNIVPGGSAANGTNFTYSPHTVNFPPNVPYNQFVTINVIDDSVANADRSFTFTLAYPTNHATLGANNQHQVTIQNDDTLKIHLLPPFTNTVLKTVGTTYIPVSLTLPSANTTSVNVHVNPVGTTAVYGTDYIFNDTTIIWAAGERGTKLVPVTVVNNALIETDKVLNLIFNNATNGAQLYDSTFSLTIVENDSFPPATIRFLGSDTTFEQTTTTVNFYVETNNPGPDLVNYTVIADYGLSTAVQGQGQDYVYSNQPRVKYPGLSVDTFPVIILANQDVSPTKTIVFRFANLSTGAEVIPDSVYTMYLTNHNKLTVSFLGAGFSYEKDTPLVQVKLVVTSLPSEPVSVNVTRSPGSAIYGTDYLFNDTTVTFPAFSRDTQGVWVTLLNNPIYQSNKQINLDLSGPTGGAVLGISAYTLTIINDDSLLGINGLAGNEGLKIYPNPVSSLLTVASENSFDKLEIRNVLGDLIATQQKNSTNNTSINVAELPKGIYLLNIIYSDKIISSRFIKTE